MEKVLVTGATGFIGSYVTEELLKQGYDVIALIHKRSMQLDKRVTVIEADICDERVIDQLAHRLDKCRILIHLAANLDMQGSDRTILTNCLGTYHLACLANIISVEKFIYVSSIPIIGVPQYLPVTEEHPVKPETLYHITKFAGEQIINQVCSKSMKTITLRIPAPIGVGMRKNNYLSVLLEKCRNNETIEIYGQGKRRQNYIDVRDIALAVMCSILSDRSGLFLIAGKREITNRDLAFLCKKITNSSSEILWGMRRDPEETNQWIISNKKAEQELGFIPQYELEETIRWINENLRKRE